MTVRTAKSNLSCYACGALETKYFYEAKEGATPICFYCPFCGAVWHPTNMSANEAQLYVVTESSTPGLPRKKFVELAMLLGPRAKRMDVNGDGGLSVHSKREARLVLADKLRQIFLAAHDLGVNAEDLSLNAICLTLDPQIQNVIAEEE